MAVQALKSKKSNVEPEQTYLAADMEPERIKELDEAVTKYIQSKDKIATLREAMKELLEDIAEGMVERDLHTYNVHIKSEVFTVKSDQEQKISIEKKKTDE